MTGLVIAITQPAAALRGCPLTMTDQILESTLPRRRINYLAIAVGTALGGLGVYLAVRVPEVRNAFLSLTPFRLGGHADIQRRMLAPRSVALASVGLAALLFLLMAWGPVRRALLAGVSRGAVLATVVLFVQGLAAVAVVVNLHAYHMRQFGRSAATVPADAVMAHTLPQAWPDHIVLSGMTGLDARIAYRTNSPDPFFLPALCYPIQFHQVWPATDDWRADEDFTAAVAARGLTHMLEYAPLDRGRPLRVTKLD